MDGASQATEASLMQCLVAALITAFATGLGALPFFFVKSTSPSTIGACNAVAAGMMFGASTVLLWEGCQTEVAYAKVTTLVGAAVGWRGMDILKRGLPDDVSVLNLRGADAKQALVVIWTMFLHSFAEGMSIGVSYGGSGRLGHAVSASLAMHNVPEGFAVSLVLVEKGVSVWAAGLASIFTSLPQPIAAIPALLFVRLFEPILPCGMGFAAGAMGLVGVTELLPEARAELGHRPLLLAAIIVVSAGSMLLWHATDIANQFA